MFIRQALTAEEREMSTKQAALNLKVIAQVYQIAAMKAEAGNASEMMDWILSGVDKIKMLMRSLENKSVKETVR